MPYHSTNYFICYVIYLLFSSMLFIFFSSDLVLLFFYFIYFHLNFCVISLFYFLFNIIFTLFRLFLFLSYSVSLWFIFHSLCLIRKGKNLYPLPKYCPLREERLAGQSPRNSWSQQSLLFFFFFLLKWYFLYIFVNKIEHNRLPASHLVNKPLRLHEWVVV